MRSIRAIGPKQSARSGRPEAVVFGSSLNLKCACDRGSAVYNSHMLRRKWKRLWIRGWRRLVSALTLAAYLVAAAGVPLPAAARKAVAVPFPCQDHPCGCSTAEQCWQSCCCFSVEERWAWARAHGVEPPPSTPRPTKSWRSVASGPQTQSSQGNKTCCQKHAPGAASSSAPVSPAPDSTSGPACKNCDQSLPETPCTGHANGAREAYSWVVGLEALKCHGGSTHWMTTGAALPPPELVSCQPLFVSCGWIALLDETFSARSSPPDVPPPRG